MTKKAIKKLVYIIKKQPVITLYLFGSQATGKTTKLSDYDFAVQINESIKPSQYFNVQLELINTITDVLHTDKIDVLIINDIRVPLSLKFRIIKDGKILYCKDEIKKSRLEVKILSEYLDRKYYHDRHIEYSLIKFAQEGLSL